MGASIPDLPAFHEDPQKVAPLQIIGPGEGPGGCTLATLAAVFVLVVVLMVWLGVRHDAGAGLPERTWVVEFDGEEVHRNQSKWAPNISSTGWGGPLVVSQKGRGIICNVPEDKVCRIYWVEP